MAAPKYGPPAPTLPGSTSKQVTDAQAVADSLPPDVLSSWRAVATALGRGAPEALNKAAAHRKSLRGLVR